MITGELRSSVDKLWEAFWTGGITNPLSVIEQISFLMFARLLDMTESRNEKRAGRLGQEHQGYFNSDEQHLRWSQFKHLDSEAMLKVIRDEVFPHFKKISENGSQPEGSNSLLGDYMKDAQLLIQKPSLLVQAANMVDSLPLTEGDTKGDLYEYLLSKLTTAGINGQFRTPRHIIRFMVDMLEPRPGEIVGDPACGTGGFLVGVLQHLLEAHSSPEGIIEHEGTDENSYTGDLLSPDQWKQLQTQALVGFDFDATMLRTAAMNLLLHGIEQPNIHYQDTLGTSFSEGKNSVYSSGYFDLILANPPFKGSIDLEGLDKTLYGQLKTKKTELLFVALILRMLKPGGRAATIVPDGVLFSSSKAHVALRKTLVDSHQLEAVISLPSGVFKPYAGVSTGIAVFTKGGATDHVFFYDVQADGFSLDDRREEIDDDDLKDALARWRSRDPEKDTDRTQKAFFVPAEEIRENKYDLSINRYKEIVYEEAKYDPPLEIIERLRTLQRDITDRIDDLERSLS